MRTIASTVDRIKMASLSMRYPLKYPLLFSPTVPTTLPFRKKWKPSRITAIPVDSGKATQINNSKSLKGQCLFDDQNNETRDKYCCGWNSSKYVFTSNVRLPSLFYLNKWRLWLTNVICNPYPNDMVFIYAGNAPNPWKHACNKINREEIVLLP